MIECKISKLELMMVKVQHNIGIKYNLILIKLSFFFTNPELEPRKLFRPRCATAYPFYIFNN